jgi:hypothetical protein
MCSRLCPAAACLSAKRVLIVQRDRGVTTAPRVGLPCSTASSRLAATPRRPATPVDYGLPHSSARLPRRFGTPQRRSPNRCAETRSSGRRSSILLGAYECFQGTPNRRADGAALHGGRVFRYSLTTLIRATGRPVLAKVSGRLSAFLAKFAEVRPKVTAGAWEGSRPLAHGSCSCELSRGGPVMVNQKERCRSRALKTVAPGFVQHTCNKQR